MFFDHITGWAKSVTYTWGSFLVRLTGMICAHNRLSIDCVEVRKGGMILEQTVIFNNFQIFPEIFGNLS